jgi:hypothetical protein
MLLFNLAERLPVIYFCYLLLGVVMESKKDLKANIKTSIEKDNNFNTFKDNLITRIEIEKLKQDIKVEIRQAFRKLTYEIVGATTIIGILIAFIFIFFTTS